MDLLSRAAARAAASTASAGASDPPVFDADVEIRAGKALLGGHLTIPESACGVVVFAHGSGSSRHSPRNRYVASILNQATLGTLLFDLLTPHEELDRANVFDIELLARRLCAVARWLRTVPEARGLPIGYFGASTGAGGALLAAADPASEPAAIVSRGGRPDLAAPRLGQVRAPTLLIVGGLDEAVLDLNRDAQAQMLCEVRLAVVPGATHLFEEPGTLQRAAELARDWFVAHLGRGRTENPRAALSDIAR
jgi:putative phosphoribosyl transferase